MSLERFRKMIWGYYRVSGRDLPWRKFPRALSADKRAYRIVVSEVMLQQTQVDRVIPYYERFIKQFPSFGSLAKASTANVLKAWQGLGYNRRALNLQKLAQIVAGKYKNKMPHDPVLLDELPGIGKGTAGSLAAFIFNKPVPFIETNIRRVFIHYFFPKKRKVHDEEILDLVRRTIDLKNPREWYSALMDYGSYLSGKIANPNRRSKHYSKQGKFRGSHRQIRGAILRQLLREPQTPEPVLAAIAGSKTKLAQVLGELEKEGFLS